jgi:hypothetical protein
MAKLDPDNWKSAKDVMDERQAAYLKRKRDDDGESSDTPLVEPEKPRAQQGDLHPKAKKQKTEPAENQHAETDEDRIRRKKEQRAAKRERKREEKAKEKQMKERLKARKREAKQVQPNKPESKSRNKSSKKAQGTSGQTKSDEISDLGDDEADELAESIGIAEDDAFTTGTKISPEDSSPSESEEEDDIFSPNHDSDTSSISSMQLPTSENTLEARQQTKPLQPPSLNEPVADHTNNESTTTTKTATPADKGDFKARFQARMQELRAQRKADDGPKSRTELLEQRRKQEERRRAEKKEQKRREKEEAARKQDEEMAKRFSPGGSGSLLGSPRSPLVDADSNNFSFGRVAFGDGTAFDPANPSLMGPQKKKGPSDPATALQAAQAKKSRIAGLDSGKQANIHDKDMWMNARKRAAGEKVKDDTSLLKKALKRHEGQKRKSEKEWNGRKEGVQKAIDMKQKKRIENLAKRQEEKHGKGKKGKVKRPGFEGSFRGRTGGGKKKA